MRGAERCPRVVLLCFLVDLGKGVWEGCWCDRSSCQWRTIMTALFPLLPTSPTCFPPWCSDHRTRAAVTGTMNRDGSWAGSCHNSQGPDWAGGAFTLPAIGISSECSCAAWRWSCPSSSVPHLTPLGRREALARPVLLPAVQASKRGESLGPRGEDGQGWTHGWASSGGKPNITLKRGSERDGIVSWLLIVGPPGRGACAAETTPALGTRGDRMEACKLEWPCPASYFHVIRCWASWLLVTEWGSSHVPLPFDLCDCLL